MATDTKNQGLRTKTILTVTHNGEDLNFLHPRCGPNTYANVGIGIEKAGLARPTMAETASLVHGAFLNPDDECSKGIKDTMKKRWFWGFTGNLYVPNEGVYVQDDPEIRDGMPVMDKGELVKRLEASDPSVRFARFGFKTGGMSPLELGKNEYVVALAGQEGAEKLAELADMHKRKPYLYSFKSVDQELTRVSALYSDWNVDWGLGVDGDSHGGNSGGVAFGVLKTGEASRAEK